MSKRLAKKYKLLRFYEEDLWGRLSLRLSFKKVKINRRFHEFFEDRRIFREDLAVEKERLQKKYGLDKPIHSNKIYRKQNAQFRAELEAFSRRLRRIHFRPAFNFRIDKGKPKRKKRRLKRFSRLLKNRHKLIKFATQAMNVRQFRIYLRKARKSRSIFVNFLRLMETRVDSLVFRLNLAETAGEARQLINHRNFLINGMVVGFPTESIFFYDVFSVKDKAFFHSKTLSLFKKRAILFSTPAYLEVNFRIMSAIIYKWPTRSTVSYVRKIDSLLLAARGPRMPN
jgi:small subunit ribosomal protein S4